nr:DUF4368 domain-containing protein [Enterococcus hulanensis]
MIELSSGSMRTNISDKLTDERFAKMSKAFEEEQYQLKKSISTIKKTLSKHENEKLNIKRFMDRVKKYTQLETLIVEIVNELIEKIVIHKPEWTKRNRILTIDIYYSFIGIVKN